MGRPTRDSEREAYDRGWADGCEYTRDSMKDEESATQIVEGMTRAAYWHGDYRGLAYKVNQHWGYVPRRGENVVKWCLYIYVREDALPLGEDGRPDRGCVQRVQGWRTDCDYVVGHEGRNGAIVEYGCDFCHSGQEDETFTAEEIARYARRTIDSILEEIPGLLVQHWRLKGLVTQAQWDEEETRCKADRAAAEVVS